MALAAGSLDSCELRAGCAQNSACACEEEKRREMVRRGPGCGKRLCHVTVGSLRWNRFRDGVRSEDRCLRGQVRGNRELV